MNIPFPATGTKLEFLYQLFCFISFPINTSLRPLSQLQQLTEIIFNSSLTLTFLCCGKTINWCLSPF